ncbi:non-lysosomal glucosylceramidase-like [Haliotis rubra]|uniref:non-lysosomal glucosylceramidase-like n=1 Tax=Haliotis rubra TaxID=36100 RepID=UPI001EE57EFF|nr:non-lysosomal glucosylceramidase-like [Haliotis rubra]
MSFVGPDKSPTTPQEHIDGVPDFGWRVPLDRPNPPKCNPFTTPRLKHIPGFVGLSLRYMTYWISKKRQGRKIFIDHLNPIGHKTIYGCPIGGMGGGSIGRGYRGEFCRFHMVPGLYDYNVVDADQFTVCIRKNGVTVLQQVLSSYKKTGKHLKAWNWTFPAGNATYHALYPRAWTVYNIPEYNVKLVCRQVSPVYPHEYKESSLPAAVFVWTIENNSTDDLDISIMFSFKNGRGVKEDKTGGCWNEPFKCDSEGGDVSGVLIHQTFRDMACTYALSAAQREGVSVSHLVSFDPQGTGSEVWSDLKEDGQLTSSAESSEKTLKGKEIAAAVCVQCHVGANTSATAEFSLVWDMPVIHFSSRGQKYHRRYARWFGTDGTGARRLSSHAIGRYKDWESKIEEWQNPILSNRNLPAWYKSALFNELYFVSDGGTVWVDPADGDSSTCFFHKDHALVKEYSKFLYLEGHEYRMFNTYDVHHYASFAFIQLWPKIQLSLQYDIAQSVMSEDRTRVKYYTSGNKGQLKTLHTVPHDVGDPEDEPWKRVNAYRIHETANWKDLNLKFVLQVYRDFHVTQDKEFMENMYPKVKGVIETALKWDIDDDGIIDNSGFADQTFDAWTMSGASAYCGGMWLASLRMTIEMASLLGLKEDMDKYRLVLDKGRQSYETKLWNGRYYNYDSSTSGHHDSLMADQLAGQWFLRASGLQDDEVFPPDHVQSVLKTIYENNVMKYGNGNMGAINGTRPDGSRDTSSCQAEEFWVGVIYGLAASMIQEGLISEGFQTAWGAYHVCWEQYGLQFQTPEAYMTSKHYRSLGYMRPLCIWSMQWTLERFQPQLLEQTEGAAVTPTRSVLVKEVEPQVPGTAESGVTRTDIQLEVTEQ